MDRIVAQFHAEQDDDLNLCLADGVAYQRDQTQLVSYDDSYFNKCAGYAGSEISQKLHQGRVAFVDAYLKHQPVVDVGIGAGEFIKARHLTWGVDVNPTAIRWLRQNRLWADDLAGFKGYTFWDVIEHCPDPGEYLGQIGSNALAYFSIPVFDDLRQIRKSKHYRPGEHLYYWTRTGFISWMSYHGFQILERSDFESRAGRDSIESFAFRRV